MSFKKKKIIWATIDFKYGILAQILLLLQQLKQSPTKKKLITHNQECKKIIERCLHFFLSKQYLHHWVCMKHVYMYQSLYHAISSLQTHMALIKSLHYFEFLFCLKNIILKITIFTRKIIEIFFLSFSDGNIKSCKPIEFSWRKLLKYWRKLSHLVILIDPNPYSLTLKKR